MKGLDYNKNLSIYIHIPFCHSKCDYCAFYSISKIACKSNEISLYLDRLKASIREINKDWKKPYYTIYIGGGNPGILGYEKLIEIIKLLEENGRAEEVTVELNPEDVNDDIDCLLEYATRISVGIQSLDENKLRMLGRNTTSEISRKALSILSRKGVNFNADIITAIPGEKIETTLSDIEIINSYNPSHISFYCLTFEEDTPLIKRAMPIGNEKEAEFLISGWKKLEKLGYEHYEISNFARPGKRSMHNQVYWHLGQYIGLGPTAESSIGYNEIVSMRNTEDIYSYIQDPAFECTPLNKSEAEEELLLLGLRISDGIDKKEYYNRFGISFDERYMSVIKNLDNKLYVNDERHFALTEEGMLTLDSIILDLAMNI